MKKQIIAIGGGGFGRSPGEGVIEKYILDQSNKERPNICFILQQRLEINRIYSLTNRDMAMDRLTLETSAGLFPPQE